MAARSAQQLRPLAVFDDILGELADIEVAGDQVVDLVDLAVGQLRAQFEAARAAGDMLAPGLGGQGVASWRRAGSSRHAARHRRCQRRCPAAIRRVNARADGLVDVAVGVVAEQPPDLALRLEGDACTSCAAVEEERQDRVLADVLSDVLLRVVGPHLLLVDVLLEDVAEHIGVDLVVVAQRAVVEMPVVVVEEVEDALEGLVGDVDVAVAALESVDLEEAAVEVGHIAEQRASLGSSCALRVRAEAIVEQAQQEVAIEGVELVLAASRLHLRRAGCAGSRVSPSRKPLLLDEVDEHQAVEHQRGVPLAVILQGDAIDDLYEELVLGLEVVVELLGDVIDVEAPASRSRHIGQRQRPPLRAGQRRVARGFCARRSPDWPSIVFLFAVGGWPAGLMLDPLPYLLRLASVRIDDEVLVILLPRLGVNLLAGRLVGDAAGSVGRADQHYHAAFLATGCSVNGSPADRDREWLALKRSQPSSSMKSVVKSKERTARRMRFIGRAAFMRLAVLPWIYEPKRADDLWLAGLWFVLVAE